MSTDICLPRVSPDDAAVTLVKWHVTVGSSVKPGDVIAEIESDKAVVELEAEESGIITEIRVPEGSDDVVTDSVRMMANTLKPSISPETVWFVTSTTPASTSTYALPTSSWRRSSSSGTPCGTLVGSYSIVSVTGSANTMPSGPKANAVPVIGTGCAGKPVAGSAVMTTSSLSAPAGKTRFTASSARETSPPAGSASAPSSTVIESVCI